MSPGIGEPVLEHLEVAQDDGEQVVEVVRHAARELAHRLHLLRLAQLLLQLVPCGQIAHEAGEEALAVGMRLADGELHREDGAVLALALDLAADADDPPLAGAHGSGRDSRRGSPGGGPASAC